MLPSANFYPTSEIFSINHEKDKKKLILTFETVGHELMAAVVVRNCENVHCCSSTCLNLNMDTIHFAINFAFVVAAAAYSNNFEMTTMKMKSKRI
jgi:hypothetical protein